jgi:hypothetical protein
MHVAIESEQKRRLLAEVFTSRRSNKNVMEAAQKHSHLEGQVSDVGVRHCLKLEDINCEIECELKS